VGAESLGIPLPGETALILAGTYAGHTHRLSPWQISALAGFPLRTVVPIGGCGRNQNGAAPLGINMIISNRPYEYA
jgi:hypothetical protein